MTYVHVGMITRVCITCVLPCVSNVQGSQYNHGIRNISYDCNCTYFYKIVLN